ncbi:NAD(P)H-dependent glycerol-3-phosphate dehydrogenase, partial [Agrococcus casei]
MNRVAVLGAGSWGTTFAKVLADGGADTRLWARRAELAHEINESRRNTQYLQGVTLPEGLRADSDARSVLEGADQVFLCVPSQQLRALLDDVSESIPAGVPVVSLMKGVEASTMMRMSEVIAEAGGIDSDRIAVVSGPNLALEIAREEPTAAVVASDSSETAMAVARTARNSYFTSFVNTDVVGTEYGGVLKNLVALAIGIVDGVGYGENTKASILTRGLAEVTEFAVAHGAERTTMHGLAGLGDLIATCNSPLSRNFSAGRLLGMGYSRDDVVERMQQVAEGLASV